MSDDAPPTCTTSQEYLFAVITRDTEFIAGAEGPNQRRIVVTAGSLVAVPEDSLASSTDLVTAHRLRHDGTRGRASARVPRARLSAP